MIFTEGFKDSIKKFGKTAALSGMLGLASLGAMSCSDPSSNDDVCNHNYCTAYPQLGLKRQSL